MQIKSDLNENVYILNQIDQNELIQIFKSKFVNTYKIIYLIDQAKSEQFKKRNKFYFNQIKHDHDHKDSNCCSLEDQKVYIPKNERSPLENVLQEATSDQSMRDHLPVILCNLQKQFNNIKQSGLKDKLPWNQETQDYLIGQVLQEGIQNELIKIIKQKLQVEQKSDSKQPDLFANPQIWKQLHPQLQLDFLSQNTLKELHDHGFSIQPIFVNNLEFNRNLYKELNFLQINQRFEKNIMEQDTRNDSFIWIKLSEIEKSPEYQNIYFISNILSSIPYELNLKTKLICQISELFQLSFFSENHWQKVLMDSSFDQKLDNGRKITVLYFCNLNQDNKKNDCIINIYPDPENLTKFRSFKGISDCLLILKSRKVAYEIKPSDSKHFIIRYWVNGPQDHINKQF